MDKYEQRRLALVRLVESFGWGGKAKVAKGIGKDSSYVSRMLYEPGKAGKKNIGEDSVDALNDAFPGWLTATTDPDVRELSNVVDRLTSTGKMQPAELQNLIAMLKAREGEGKP